MKSALKALVESTMTPTAASACSQRMTQVVSTCPFTILAALIFMMLVIIMKMLRHRMAPSVIFLRRFIFIRQIRRTGIEITKKEVSLVNVTGSASGSRKTSVRMSNIVTALTTAFSLARAPGVTQPTIR